MNQLRGAVIAFGIVPAMLVVCGLLLPSKYSKTMIVIGALWGVASALFAVREVHATVTAGEPEITYSGAP